MICVKLFIEITDKDKLMSSSNTKYFRADVSGEIFPRLFVGGVYACDAVTAEKAYEISEKECLRLMELRSEAAS